MTEKLDPSWIRGLVREVISEIVSDRVNGCNTGAGGPGEKVAKADPVVEEVTITSDDALAAFVKRLLSLSKNTEEWLSIEEGQRTFRLKCGAAAAAPKAREPEGMVEERTERIEKGPVSEARIVALGRAGVTRLILGKTALLTPLARDRAREMKIHIQKETR